MSNFYRLSVSNMSVIADSQEDAANLFAAIIAGETESFIGDFEITPGVVVAKRAPRRPRTPRAPVTSGAENVVESIA